MLKNNFSFELIAQDEKSRLGKISTPRGEIHTPAFMPVGTLGTVKGLFVDDVIKTGSEIILANTYHLMIRPGTKIIKEFWWYSQIYELEKTYTYRLWRLSDYVFS